MQAGVVAETRSRREIHLIPERENKKCERVRGGRIVTDVGCLAEEHLGGLRLEVLISIDGHLITKQGVMMIRRRLFRWPREAWHHHSPPKVGTVYRLHCGEHIVTSRGRDSVESEVRDLAWLIRNAERKLWRIDRIYRLVGVHRYRIRGGRLVVHSH